MEKIENEEDYTFPTFNGMNRPAMMYGIPMMIGLIVLIYIVLSGFIGFQMGLGKFSLIAPSFGVIFLIVKMTQMPLRY